MWALARRKIQNPPPQTRSRGLYARVAKSSNPFRRVWHVWNAGIKTAATSARAADRLFWTVLFPDLMRKSKPMTAPGGDRIATVGKRRPRAERNGHRLINR